MTKKSSFIFLGLFHSLSMASIAASSDLVQNDDPLFPIEKSPISSSETFNADPTVVPAPSTNTTTNQLKEVTVPRHENRLFLTADFIYWLAKQEGNEYAVTGSPITVPGTTDPNTGLVPGSFKQGKVHELDFELDPGFKVGGGINLSHGSWDVSVEYTYLHSNAKGSVKSNDLNAGIIPLFAFAPNNSILAETTFVAASGAQGFVSQAKSSWSLSFNNINLELGRNVRMLNYLTLRPFFGLQGAWHKQDFDVFYQVNSFTNVNQVLGSNRIDFDQSFLGLGGRLGVSGSWECFSHLDIFANFSSAILWGLFKSKGKSFDTNQIAGYENVLISNQRSNTHDLNPLLGIQIGLRSPWTLYDKYRLLFQAGWESQIWFFQNQHSSPKADSSLIFQGLTLKARFDF